MLRDLIEKYEKLTDSKFSKMLANKVGMRYAFTKHTERGMTIECITIEEMESAIKEMEYVRS